MASKRVRETVAEVLGAPYARVFRAEAEGGFTAEVLEFPGCISAGEDAAEAMRNLEEAIAAWVEAKLMLGAAIPPPLASAEYNGRISLRVPPSLHERVLLLAVAEGVSLNRWLSAAIAAETGMGSSRSSSGATIAALMGGGGDQEVAKQRVARVHRELGEPID